MIECWDNDEEFLATAKGIKFVKQAMKFFGLDPVETLLRLYWELTPEDSSWGDALEESQSLEESNPEEFYGQFFVFFYDYNAFKNGLLPILEYWCIQKGYINNMNVLQNISDIDDIYDLILSQYLFITGTNTINNNDNPLIEEFRYEMFTKYQFVEHYYSEYSYEVYFDWAGAYYYGSITPSTFANTFFTQTNNQTGNYFYIATNMSGFGDILGQDDYLLVATIDLSKYSVRIQGFDYPIDLTIVNKTEYNSTLSKTFSASKDNTLDVYTFKDSNVGSALYNFLYSNSEYGNGSQIEIPMYIYPV